MQSVRPSSVALALLLSACGGATHSEPVAVGGASGAGGVGAAGTGGDVTATLPRPPLPITPPEEQEAQEEAEPLILSDYVETVCPEQPAPEVEEGCELFGTDSGCPEGEACYPFVEYPDPNDDCAQEKYGTYCRLEGTREQGEDCSSEGCRGSHLCVVTGEGTQCVALCKVTGPNLCPAGLFCVPIDVQPGVGGCY